MAVQRYLPVKGYEHYVVCDDGTIISPKLGRPLKPAISHKGYCQVKLYDKQGNKKTIPVHRIVAKTFLDNPKNLQQVNHIDGNKQNNHYTNLEWCTNSDNLAHAQELGLNDCRGEKSKKNKYPESLIRLCLETRGKIKGKDFASKYKMPYLYVKAVRGGHRWNWLWREYYGS